MTPQTSFWLWRPGHSMDMRDISPLFLRGDGVVTASHDINEPVFDSFGHLEFEILVLKMLVAFHHCFIDLLVVLNTKHETNSGIIGIREGYRKVDW